MKVLPSFVPSEDVQVEPSPILKARKSRHHPRALAIAYGAFLLFLAFVCFLGLNEAATRE